MKTDNLEQSAPGINEPAKSPEDRLNAAIERLISLAGDAVSPGQVLLAPRVRKMFGDISKTTLWRWTHDPASDFPRPFKVKGDTDGWYLHELLSHVRDKAAKRRAGV